MYIQVKIDWTMKSIMLKWSQVAVGEGLKSKKDLWHQPKREAMCMDESCTIRAETHIKHAKKKKKLDFMLTLTRIFSRSHFSFLTVYRHKRHWFKLTNPPLVYSFLTHISAVLLMGFVVGLRNISLDYGWFIYIVPLQHRHALVSGVPSDLQRYNIFSLTDICCTDDNNE